MTQEELRERLDAFVGAKLGAPRVARDPVNQPMIRHWCDAVGDRNPVYVDPELARRTVHGGVVAPPAMLQAWVMPGLAPPEERESAPSPQAQLFALLDGAGFTSVVATDCRQEYRRYLRPGDLVSVESEIESISNEKRTALGPGHFVTQRMIYRDERGDVVATMRFRLLKFRPPERKAEQEETAKPSAPPRAPRRPRPGITHDNAFFWEGVAARQLRIQRCGDCGRLRHPPLPSCPNCRSLAWDAVEARGRGHVYSYVVAHHPPIPPFRYPNPIGLVELEEGVRLVTNLIDVAPEAIHIGMPVELVFTEVEEGRWPPLFRPAPPESRS